PALPLPDDAAPALRRLPRTGQGPPGGHAPRRVLRGVLLGADGGAGRRRRDEHRGDGGAGRGDLPGEAVAPRGAVLTRRRRGVPRDRRARRVLPARVPARTARIVDARNVVDGRLSRQGREGLWGTRSPGTTSRTARATWSV